MSNNSFIKNNICNVDLHISQKYDLKRRIGKGAYGIVWKAIDREKKAPVAVKKIYDAFRNPTDAQRTFREIAYLREFKNHPNIVKLLNVHRANNNSDIYLVFEYVETDLHKCIKREKILQDVHKRYIIYQLLKALKYIHSGNVIHRDLKPPNILINSQCHCKIADFGLARSVAPNVNEKELSFDALLTDYIATRWYRAPEVLIASKTYSKSIDIWSLGCILGEMLLGKPLFPGSSTVNQLELIINVLGPISSNDADSVCTGYGNSLLKQPPSPAKATSLSTLLPNAPADALDLLNQFLTLNPNRRLTAAEALKHNYIQMFSKPVEETTLNHSVVPPIRDDIRLSIDYYRNKINDSIKKNEQKQTKMIKPSSADIPGNRNNKSDTFLSQMYAVVRYNNPLNHKSQNNRRSTNHLRSLENKIDCIESLSFKHPATHPPHRTSDITRISQMKQSSSREKVHSLLHETNLKSLTMRVQLPPAEPVLPNRSQNSQPINILKNIGKTYLTTIQEYALMAEASKSVLGDKIAQSNSQKLQLPKTRTLNKAKPSIVCKQVNNCNSNSNERVNHANTSKPVHFTHSKFSESMLKKNVTFPVQTASNLTLKKKLSSPKLYPYLNPPINGYKPSTNMRNYSCLFNK